MLEVKPREGAAARQIMETLRSLAIVADEQDFYSAGLATMLQRQMGFASVQRARSLAQVEQLLSAGKSPDLLVIDPELPGSHGAETLRQLHDLFPPMRLAVFSKCSGRREIFSLLAAGAHGFISKDSDPTELLHALCVVEAGGVFVPPILMDDVGETAKARALVGLTERQRQVTELIMEGHPNKVIARELGISPSTVKVHVHAAFRALGVHSRVGAVVALQRAGSR